MSLLPLDKDMAAAGQTRIDWAKALMPILANTARTLQQSNAFDGNHIGVCLPIDAKLANLALTLAASGAKVSCCAPATYSDINVVHCLREQGISVFSNEQTGDDNNQDAARAFLASTPDILIDSGANIIQLAQQEYPVIFARLKGVTECQKTGMRKIRALLAPLALDLPVVNLNDTALTSLLNNTFGVGQSAVMALLDLTNLQIAGRQVLVIGYGTIGKGIAATAAALGARVTVAEIDPMKAMQAQYDGHVASCISDAATKAEVVFSATGCDGTITAEHIEKMPDGVILCSAGGGQSELPMAYLAQAEIKVSVRAHITDFHFSNGKKLLLIADGHCLNTAAAEGAPIEIVDKLMTMQLKAVEFLLSEDQKKPSDIESMLLLSQKKIAIAHLNMTGASIGS